MIKEYLWFENQAKKEQVKAQFLQQMTDDRLVLLNEMIIPPQAFMRKGMKVSEYFEPLNDEQLDKLKEMKKRFEDDLTQVFKQLEIRQDLNSEDLIEAEKKLKEDLEAEAKAKQWTTPDELDYLDTEQEQDFIDPVLVAKIYEEVGVSLLTIEKAKQCTRRLNSRCKIVEKAA